MKLTLEQLTAHVATYLGEPSLGVWGESDSPFPALRERVALIAEDVAAEIVGAYAPEDVSLWKQLPATGEKKDDDGSTVIVLPDDFMSLVSVRLKGWKREAVEVLPPSHVRVSRRGCSPALEASASRPIAVAGWSGERRTLRLFPGSTDMVYGWYVARPMFDATGSIELPREAFLPFLRRMRECLEADA